MANRTGGLAALLAAAIGLAQGPGGDKPAGLAGVVTDSISGEPVPRAHVMLRGVAGGRQLKYGATTDNTGKFSVTGLPAATYSVQAERVGFETPSPLFGAPPLTLAAGDDRSGVQVVLIPLGSISGRVLNPEGEPMENIWVGVEGEGATRGFPESTDDRGQFRIGGLTAGRYQVFAEPQAMRPVPPEIRSDGSVEAHYRVTYYPNAIAQKGAAPVSVRAGNDTPGIDIRLVRGPMLRVSGKAPGGGANGNVEARREGKLDTAVPVKPDGTFTFWRMDPGQYTLSAIWGSNTQQMRSAPVGIQVSDSNIDGLELRAIPNSDIAGRVVYEDDEARPTVPGPQRSVVLRDLDQRVAVQPARIGADDTFRLESVPAGRYRVLITPPPVYVKAVRLGPAEAAGDILDVRHGAAGAAPTLVLSGALGSVSGQVTGDGTSASHARVVLLPEDPNAGLNAVVTATTASGAYGFENVRPGHYKLVAVDPGGGRTLDDYVDEMEHIEVVPRDRLMQDLKLPPQFQIGQRK